MKTFDTTTVGDVMHEGVVTCDVDEPSRPSRAPCSSAASTASSSGTNRPPRPIPRSGASSPTSTVAATEDTGARTAGGAQRPRRCGHAGGERFGERPS